LKAAANGSKPCIHLNNFMISQYMAERKVLADALRQGKLFVLAVRVEEWQRRRAEANNLAMKMSNETFSQVLPGRAKHTRLQLARDYYQPENQNRTTFLEATKTKVDEVEKDGKGWSESVRIRLFKQSEESLISLTDRITSKQRTGIL
jgi:hypothetical protein